jgi:hypothetical protein
VVVAELGELVLTVDSGADEGKMQEVAVAWVVEHAFVAGEVGD